MMKWFWIAVLAGAAWYFYSHPEILDNLERAAAPITGEPVGEALYRWQDADGNIHFGDEPPQGVAYEKVIVDPDASVTHFGSEVKE